MMSITVVKCHGSGNDFLLLDMMDVEMTYDSVNWSACAKQLCNRSESLGADGILLVENSAIADARMRVFNADGSEASMCGNGLRCVARFTTEKLKRHHLMIETKHSILAVGKRPDDQAILQFAVEISPISFRPSDLPMNTVLTEIIDCQLPFLAEDLTFTAVASPNPHLITVVDTIDTARQDSIARRVNQQNPWFPDGVNVSFVQLIGLGEIFVQTYERGVGFTNACGTAMSAASLVTYRLGKHGDQKQIKVYNPGGQVTCIVQEDAVELIGNATYEYTGRISHLHEENACLFELHEEYSDEIAKYQQFQQAVSMKLGRMM